MIRETCSETRGTPATRQTACVNRLYYSCFYAVSALLVRDGLSSLKHAGVRSLFKRHYVRTGKVPMELARSVHRPYCFPLGQ